MSTNPSAPGATTKRARSQALNAVSLSASLTVKDLQKSLAWYRDVVGFAVDEEHRREGELRAVSLKAGAVRIVIGRDDGAKGWDRVKGEGFSLQITTTENVDELANRIKERGGHLASEPADMPWGARVFRLQDPDGFKLVISSER
jgi:lactoylglutathione lyase